MDQFMACLSAVANRVLELARSDRELNSRLLTLLRTLQDSIEAESQPATQPNPVSGFDSDSSGGAELRSTSESNEAFPRAEAEAGQKAEILRPEPPQLDRTPLPKLTLGQGSNELAKVPPLSSTLESTYRGEQLDFALIEQRCRLKADAARWASTRRKLVEQGAEFSTHIAPKDKELITRAKALPNCFLWMSHPNSSSANSAKLYDQAADCYDTFREILLIVKELHLDKAVSTKDLTKGFELLTEAQSALRTAVDRLDGGVDSDQYAVYEWLKRNCFERQIYMPRYMRADDPADPANTYHLRAQAEAFESSLRDNQQRQRKQRKLLGKVRHKSDLIKQGAMADLNLWQSIWAIVDELINNGLPPSHVDLREYLLPIIEDMPGECDVPIGATRVLNEIDRYLSVSAIETPTKQPAFSQDVARVAGLLNGQSMIVIGGYKRQASANALKSAFGLKDLHWIETRPHEPVQNFEPYVARPEVALVVLAIRWSSHSYGEVRSFCQRYGKPLVRLPSGYSPNQMAAQILSQCSETLEATLTTSVESDSKLMDVPDSVGT